MLKDLRQAARRIPILPLPDTVLFPKATASIHLYEVRFLRMLYSVLSSNSLLVIVKLKPGWEEDYFGSPPVFEIGCLGEVAESKPVDNQGFRVKVVGISRVRVLEEFKQKPYRVGRVELLDQSARTHDINKLQYVFERLWDLFEKLIEYLPDHGANLRTLVRKELPPWEAGDLISAYLLRDADLKQKLLQELDPLDRQNYLINTLQDYLERAHFLRGGKKETPPHPWWN